MAISNHAELKAAIADWLDRADVADRIPDFVALATATLNKVLRDRRMLEAATLAVAADERFVGAPAETLEPIFACLSDGTVVEKVSPERLAELRRARMRQPGTPRYFAAVGSRLELCPTPGADGSLELQYYRKIPALSADEDTNWVLAEEPDLYLYTALLHAARYLADTPMAMAVEALLARTIGAALAAEGRATDAAQ